jgi:hypothetical protein
VSGGVVVVIFVIVNFREGNYCLVIQNLMLMYSDDAP